MYQLFQFADHLKFLNPVLMCGALVKALVHAFIAPLCRIKIRHCENGKFSDKLTISFNKQERKLCDWKMLSTYIIECI